MKFWNPFRSKSGPDGEAIASEYRRRMCHEIADVEARSAKAGLLPQMRLQRHQVLNSLTHAVVTALAKEHGCSTEDIAGILQRHPLPSGAPDPFAVFRGPGRLLEEETQPTAAEVEDAIFNAAEGVGISRDRMRDLTNKYGGK